jgi:hypothetical protein
MISKWKRVVAGFGRLSILMVLLQLISWFIPNGAGQIVKAESEQKLWILPSSARSSGAQNSFWVTDFTLANYGITDVDVMLKFLGNNQDGNVGPERSYKLGFGQSITFNDVLQSVFGIASRYGAILLASSSSSLSMLGQTYTAGAGGTYGQSVPAFSRKDWIAEGTPHAILGVRDDTAFRTNLILANPTVQPLDVNVTLIDNQGNRLAEKSYALYPQGMTQISSVIRKLGWNDPIGSANLLLAATTPGGAFSAYASVIDNVTNDPRTLLPLSESGWLLPSSARVSGQGNAFWSSKLALFNQSKSEAAVVMKFLGNNIDGREGIEKNVVLPAGESLVYDDVLGELFGIASGWGAIAAGSSNPSLYMTAQTSTPGNGGTFGQSVPATATQDLITCATPGSIVAIREDANFRTNLILANATELSLDVEATLFDNGGHSLGARQYTLHPCGMTQLNRVVAQEFGIDTGLDGARLSLKVLTAGGAISTYASTIDNVTNDPRTLLPTLHRQFLPEATVFGGESFAGIDCAGMTFTPDGNTFYMGSIGNNRSGATGLEILTSKLVNGNWTPPAVAEFSKSYGGRIHDFAPFISPDGLKLFFVSGRPISGTTMKDDDIWVMDKTENGWNEPRNLGSPVNSSNHEYMPAVARDGTLYFSLLGDLYCSPLIAGRYSTPAKLPYPVNVPTYDDNNPFISPEGNLLLFSSERPGGFGGYDIYVSKKIDGSWSTPKNLGPKVNSDLWDTTPSLSPDGKTLFFTRLKVANNKRQDSKIYQIDASVLDLD